MDGENVIDTEDIKDIVRKYIKDNLRVDIDSYADFEGKGFKVDMLLEGEVMYTDVIMFELYDY